MSSTAQLSAKDRISTLLDENSFVEIGALVTKRSTDFNLQQKEVPSDGVITGYGIINNKLVYVYSQDVTAMNGTMGEMHARKITRIYDLAMKTGTPVIGMIDCAGLRLQEAADALAGFGDIYTEQVMASGVIPQISVIFGTCGGGSAISASLSDFVFMEEKNAKLFVNSPNVIEGNYISKCDTASASFMAGSGVADFVCGSEEELLGKVRELIDILPRNNEDDPAVETSNDDLNRDVVLFDPPADDIAKAISELSDNGLFIECKSAYAKEMVTGFIRLNGMTIGVAANRRAVTGEDGKAVQKFDTVLTSAGCQKAEKFVKICNAFNIPILTLTNVTGFSTAMSDVKSIGDAAAKLTYAFINSSVPKVNIVIGKAYGSAYVVMNSKNSGADMVFALDNTEIGTMDAEIAAQIMYPEASVNDKKEKADEYRRLCQSIGAAAKRGYVDAVISSDSVRRQLIFAFEVLYTKRDARPTKKHGTI